MTMIFKVLYNTLKGNLRRSTQIETISNKFRETTVKQQNLRKIHII